MAVLPELIRRYEAGEVTFEEISEQAHIPKTSLYRYFREMEVPIKAEPELTRIKVEKALREKEITAVTDEAVKIYDVAIGLGSVIARRYTPLIDHLMGEGKTTELIAEDLMAWFETKRPTLEQIESLKNEVARLEKSLTNEVARLKEELREAYEISEPNRIFEVKSQRLFQFAQEALRYRASGLRFPVKSAVRAFQDDLDTLEKQVRNMKKEAI